MITFLVELFEASCIANFESSISRDLVNSLIQIFPFDNLKQMHPMIQAILLVHVIIQSGILFTVVGTQPNQVA